MHGDHDPHHQPEGDLLGKGLSEGAVGLFGGTVLGISSVAPAYALTATIGILVAEAGNKMPVIIIAGFLPMFFAAYAYRELNKVAPDCGTSFTWTTKAFGPYVGWFGGWAAILATVIVLSNLAGVAVQFFYQFLGDVLDTAAIGDLWENRLINVLTCIVFIAPRDLGLLPGHHHDRAGPDRAGAVPGGRARGPGHRGLRQVRPSSVSGIPFDLDWFSPTGLTVSAFVAGPLGLDLRLLGLGHRTHRQRGVHRLRPDPGTGGVAVRRFDPAHLPVGRRSPSRCTPAWVTHRARSGQRGDLGQHLRRAGSSDPGSTTRPGAVPRGAGFQRGQPDHHLPADLTHHARDGGPTAPSPQEFATIHPVYKTPSYATVAAGIGAAAFYSVLTFVSERVLTDTIYSLGIMICFYYGLTAFACIWFFRRELFDDVYSVVFKLVFPLLGGLGLFAVFVVTLRDSASPDYGSGASIGGVGLVLILGLGLIVLGAVFMMIQRARHPAFFRGETLKRHTPALVLEEP